MPIIDNLFERYKNTDYFIESGSFTGNGIQRAIEAGFTHISSIELSQEYFKHCEMRFKNNSRVHLFLGDTEDVLEMIIAQITEPITFWLDGHYSGANTALGKHESPLMQELEIIKRHPVNIHTIMIDDLRCWKRPHYDFDTDNIIEFLKTINQNYEIVLEDGIEKNDILVAHIK
jgi:hypothetical protein